MDPDYFSILHKNMTPIFSGGPWAEKMILSLDFPNRKSCNTSQNFPRGHTKFLAWSEYLGQLKNPTCASGTVCNIKIHLLFTSKWGGPQDSRAGHTCWGDRPGWRLAVPWTLGESWQTFSWFSHCRWSHRGRRGAPDCWPLCQWSPPPQWPADRDSCSQPQRRVHSGSHSSYWCSHLLQMMTILTRHI